MLIFVHNFNLALAFFSNDWAISLKDKVWSNAAPKLSTDVVDLIAKLLQVISRLGLHLNFWGETNRMDSVLPRWSESLLSINHWLKQFKSSVKSCSISCLFLPVTKISESFLFCFWQQLTCHWRKLKIKEVLKLSLGGRHRWWENPKSVSQINLLIVFYLKDMIWTTTRISLPRPEALLVS